ncbi:MAG: PKD domain-containing protein [Planctomycetes bacterium]|nr:PKD domain-containing protein [Planctomycetota bacterium]
MQRLLVPIALVSFAAVASAQLSVVLPNGMATAEGSSANAFPWGRGGAGILMQCVYDSSHFTAQGITYPIVIQGLRWRPNTNVALVATTFPTPCEIRLSTSPIDWSGVTTTFANHRGLDETLCFQGPVTFPAQPAQVGPTPFGINVPLTTPFVYDPNNGDLNIECNLPIQTGYVGGAPQLDVHATVGQANASRVYWTTGFTNPGYPGTVGTGISTNHAVVVQVDYVPAAGLYPAFTASPTSGPLNTSVTFTNSTFTSDPGGVLAYQWDFENDGTWDSSATNPTHTYATEGIYSVKLQATDALNGTQTFTRTNYITIDAVDASFTATVVTGTTVLFQDTSTGSPTSWSWDFENDGIVDATGPTAVFTYPAPGAYNCKLTASDAISTDTAITNLGLGIIPVPNFGSTFSSTVATRGFWFQAPTRFSIVSANVPNEFVPAETIQNVGIYRLTAAPPVYSATATGGLELAALTQPAGVPIPCAVSFDAGEWVGVLGACGTTTMRNSYGTPTGSYASSVLGVPTTLTRFGTQFNINTTGANHPYWQEPTGAISRVILGVSACTSVPYGTGTPSGLGPVAPTLRNGTLPFIGTNATMIVNNQDVAAIGVMAVGTGRANLPVPGIGTILLGTLDATFVMPTLPLAIGDNAFTFAIPNNPALNGAGPLNWQNANINLPNGEFALSNALEWYLGL